jgi:hypothetical protein
MNFELHVALDTTAKNGEPEVVVIPKHLAFPARTQHSLSWTQLDNESFTFVSLTPLDQVSPFSKIVCAPQLITAQYNNQRSGPEYEYTIVVADASSQHSQHSTVPKGRPIETGGGPTIKNN